MSRDAIIAEARSWIGTPYRHQASLKGVGADCLGLLRGVWRGVIGAEPEAVPPYGDQQRDELLLAAARRNLRELPSLAFRGGDVLLFRWLEHLPARHVGIATSPSTMVHAQSGSVVAEVPLDRWWRMRLVAVFEFPGQ